MSLNQYSSDIPETPWWCTQQQQQQQQQGILMEPLIQSASSCGPPIYPSWPTQTQLYHHHRQQQLMNRGFNLNQDELELEVEEEEELEEAAEEEEQGGSSSQSIYVENGRCWRSAGGGGGGEVEEKEAMFEKALTPSDVGKLNRLVIPKQQAEKYFPLSDSGDNKGVLLSFEDESAKCWRFRYSYWNSSQSYVLTKGWSRYVKDKRLHAGDVVSFHRLRSLPHRLFITWRRRHTAPSPGRAMAMAVGTHASTAGTATNTSNTKGVGVSVGWTTMPFYSAHPYPTHQTFPSPPQTDFHAPGRGSQSEKQITGNSCKVLRLFGVNMECQTEPDESGPSRPEYPIHMMSSSTHHDFYQYHHLHPSYAPNPHHHMDVNQMRNRPG